MLFLFLVPVIQVLCSRATQMTESQLCFHKRCDLLTPFMQPNGNGIHLVFTNHFVVET